MALLRLLLIFILGWIVWRLLRPDAPKSARDTAEKQDEGDENIAACAWCDVHVPEKEMTQAQDGQRYCCEEHLRAGQAAQKERK